ncbi:MAG TPA: hypothetical protein VH062_35230 [Polyangiaceae bacterium]|jgi:hypothetical protein|nr:hypothetical protein [Polyangiaceae bacterium]
MNKQSAIASIIVSSLFAWGCGAADPMSAEEINAQYGDKVGTVESAVIGTFVALPSLPVVTTVNGFALTASADDGGARLGFMFTDPTYRQTLLNAGTIQNMGGSYDGPGAYATYKIVSSAWSPYEGRTTPQTYAFSELVVASSASYYTTNYPSFGGLVSAIRNGGKGVYALTPAFTTRKAHSIAVPVGSTVMYSLVAQSGTTGLTFSNIAINQFGITFPNAWVNMATLATDASTAKAPQLVVAGTKMAASYILNGDAVIRATNSASGVTSATSIPVIGGCAGSPLADIAWDGSLLWVACTNSAGTLTVKKASLASLTGVVFTTVPTSITGNVTDLDFEASSTGVSIAVRVGTSVKVYKNVTDATANFDDVRSGTFDLARTSNGITLAICDMAGDRTLRTWVSP